VLDGGGRSPLARLVEQVTRLAQAADAQLETEAALSEPEPHP
jgi:hypothetical protein